MLKMVSALFFGTAVVQSTQGTDYSGIAAVIAASAGMVSAVGAIVIGLRSKKNTAEDVEKELLMRLLKEQLEKDEKDQP